MSLYISASNTPQGSWTIIGLGLRMAQDVGIHRKKMYSSVPSVEDELWKRAFWYTRIGLRWHAITHAKLTGRC